MAEIFVRDSLKGPLHESPNIDLVLVSGKQFALIHFENDEIGTVDSDPLGTGFGISSGSTGRVGNLTVESAGDFDSATAPVPPGRGQGILQMTPTGNVVIKDAGSFSGEFRPLGSDQLPMAMWKYVEEHVPDKLSIPRIQFQ